MIRNKGFRRVLLSGCAMTLAASACGLFFFGTPAGILILALGAAMTSLYLAETGRRYKALEELNLYLSGILSGGEGLELSDQEEGELSILRTNIYKATTTLSTQKELLAGDRKRLADAMADISHQLKTPLTSMMVMNDLLHAEKDPGRRKEFLSIQSAQLDRMNWLIQTLLKLSRLDAGTVALKREEVASGELIRSALKPFEIQMELAGMTTSVSGAEVPVRCDRNWTAEALQNIIKNCYEHMEPSGTLGIAVEDTSLFTEISISDTGSGIAPEDLPHIFERFYRGKNAEKDSVGIGLALSKAILEAQCGEILVESVENAGTRFRLRFYKTIL